MFFKDVIELKHLRMETCSKKHKASGEQGKVNSYQKMKIMEERSEDLKETITHTTQTIQT